MRREKIFFIWCIAFVFGFGLIKPIENLHVLKTTNLLLRPSVTGEKTPFVEACDKCLFNKKMCDLCDLLAVLRGKWNRLKLRMGVPAPWVVVKEEDGNVLGLCGFDSIKSDKSCAEIVVNLLNEDNDLVKEALVAAIRYAFDTCDIRSLIIKLSRGEEVILDGLGISSESNPHRYRLCRDDFIKPDNMATPVREEVF